MYWYLDDITKSCHKSKWSPCEAAYFELQILKGRFISMYVIRQYTGCTYYNQLYVLQLTCDPLQMAALIKLLTFGLPAYIHRTFCLYLVYLLYVMDIVCVILHICKIL